jgi:hypothetical protein
MLGDDFHDSIDDQSYPVSATEFVAAVGDDAGPTEEELDAVLARAGADTLTDADDARDTVLCGLGGDAVGRRRYSDRDPGGFGETRHRELSF